MIIFGEELERFKDRKYERGLLFGLSDCEEVEFAGDCCADFERPSVMNRMALQERAGIELHSGHMKLDCRMIRNYL